MIQRQQTLWLLLAGVASFFTYQYPFYTGTKIENHLRAELDAGSNLFLVVLTGISILVALIAIFLFKDRKTQLKVTIAGLIISIIMVIIYISQIKTFEEGRLSLTCLLALIIPIAYLMAARGIWKDQKLVKSLDKLR